MLHQTGLTAFLCFEFVGDMLHTCFMKHGLKWLKSNKGRVLGLFQTYLKQTQNKFFEFFNLEHLFQWGSLFLAPYVVILDLRGCAEKSPGSELLVI